jgi:hypothetical protein
MCASRRSHLPELADKELLKSKKRALVFVRMWRFLPEWQPAPSRSAAFDLAATGASVGRPIVFVAVGHIGQFAGFLTCATTDETTRFRVAGQPLVAAFTAGGARALPSRMTLNALSILERQPIATLAC